MDKETLSRVGEYAAGVRINRTPVVAPTAAPRSTGTPDQGTETQASGARLLDPKVLEQALSNLSAHVQNLQRSLQFSVDKESGETIVKVVDTETKEVIRQIPSEELLVIAHRLRSTAGVLLTEHV